MSGSSTGPAPPKNVNGRHYIGLILLATTAMLVSVPYFTRPAQWIFLNADEAKYSFGAHQLLSTGSWGYSGRKPGSALIIAAAQLLLGDTPTASLYAEGIVGVLLVLVVYKIARHYMAAPVAALGTLITLSSPFFQYYTKTHIIFSSFFFALGVLLYLQSLTTISHSRTLFLSGLSMGAGLSCYYNLEIYIPILVLPELVLWRQTGELRLRTRALRFLGGVALIPFLMDTYALAYWAVFHRFSEPVTMSLFDHLILTHVGGFHYPWDRFTSLFAESEGKTLSILLMLGLLILSRRVIRHRAVKDVVLLGLIFPVLLLQIRAWMGHLSVLRTFFSGYIFMLLIALLPLAALWNTISARLPHAHAKYVLRSLLSMVLLGYGWRTYTTFQNISTVSTGYHEVDRFFQQVDADRVAYWGNQFAWRYYFRGMDALELHTEGHVDLLRVGGVQLSQELEPYQWLVVNQVRASDLDWIEKNLSGANFVFHRAFASNEFDFSLVRQEGFSNDYASYDVTKDIRIYEKQAGS